MARNRISGLGMTVLGSAILLAGACDSGGTTVAPTGTGTGTSTGTGGGGGVSAGTGGAKVGTGTGGAKVSTGTGGTPNTTGTGGAGNTTSASCTGLTPPTGTGSLNVANGYVTVGSLKGYGFAWKGDKSNTTTCITPTCGATGCLPLFGSSALCAAGVVTGDSTYNSIVGVGFNFNQAVAGGTGSELTVSAPANIVVGATLGSGTGDAAARIQIVSGTGTTAVNYCVEKGTWTSGTPIPIGNFNTSCWDTTLAGATALTAGAAITSIDIVIPSDATADRSFSVCLTNVTFQ